MDTTSLVDRIRARDLENPAGAIVPSRNGRRPAKRTEPESAAKAAGLPLKTLRQMRAEAEAEPKMSWLVEGLLPADGMSLMVAAPKVGKSTLARCLALAVATGGEWLGRAVSRGRVVHLALEERTATVVRHYDGLTAPDDDILAFVGPAPAPAERLSLLRAAIESVRPSLVIVDPLQRWVRIADGNSYSEATEALTPLIGLARQYGTHIMLVHHSRKSGGQHGEEVLGSTALAGSVDTTISLAISGGRRIFYAVGRDGVDVEKTTLEMDANGWVHTGATKHEAELQDMASRVYEWLEAHGEAASKEEIRKGLGACGTAVVRALNRLVEDRQVMTSGRGVRGNPFVYSVLVP